MTDPRPAVIYCRVSSRKQKTEGSGLESQESRCRDYAENKGYDVEAVFPDDITGAGDFMNRPGMVNLLRYLDAQKSRNYVVIFDDLKRFARDTEFHIKLRREFDKRGATIECLNFKFENSPEGRFIETILAAQGELERKQNGRQTIQKMQARMAAGYWCFHAPIGYRYARDKTHGKILIRDEPAASVIVEAFEGYASGRFQNQAEIKRFFEAHPGFPKGSSKYVTQQRVTEILTNPLYAGYFSKENWGFNMVQGQHEALISHATFQQVQDRRAGAAKAPARKDIHADFPLRGFISCGCCGAALTACWSKGRSKKYPYYLCDSKVCASYRKSIKRDRIEGDFEALLRRMQPAANLFALAFEMFRDLWDQRLAQVGEERRSLERQISQLERKSTQLLDRLIDTDSATLIKAYESRLEEMNAQKRFLGDQLAKIGVLQPGFKEIYRTAFDFLANPWKLWASERLEDKRAVLKLVFADRLHYDRETGYRTAKTTLPFKALADFSNNESEMVPPHGLEPRTY